MMPASAMLAFEWSAIAQIIRLLATLHLSTLGATSLCALAARIALFRKERQCMYVHATDGSCCGVVSTPTCGDTVLGSLRINSAAFVVITARSRVMGTGVRCACRFLRASLLRDSGRSDRAQFRKW
ncbi:hypothetical protein GNP09_18165 [Escherichia coli]|nr:hypothetical protein [Escherichia coli]